MKFKLRNIDANPWRRMERYPIRRDKVEALKESIATTDWWNNVVARIDPGNPARAQLAYGHHRRQALLELFDPDYEVDLNIRDLSDALMIKMMARENMDEWGSSALAQHETVRTVVEAFAAGSIDLHEQPETLVHGDQLFADRAEEWLAARTDLSDSSIASFRSVLKHHILPAFAGRTVAEVAGDPAAVSAFLESIKTGDSQSLRKTATTVINSIVGKHAPSARRADMYGGRARIAPSFIIREVTPETDLSKAYTIPDIARFTGWTQADGSAQWKVRDTLNVLEVIELGLLTESDFEGLSSWQAGKVADKARIELKTRQQLANLEPRPEVKEKIIAEGRADAAELARHIITDLKSKERGTGQIEDSAAASGKMLPRPPKEPPQIDVFAERLATSLQNMLSVTPSNRRIKNLELFINFQDKATDRSRRELAAVLRQLAARATEYADQLKIADEPARQLSSHIPALERGTK